MRVLKYLDTIDRGGAEIQALDICKNAARYGIEITLMTRGGALEQDFAATGIEMIKVRRRLPVDLLLSSEIRRVINERDIQIVHGYQAVDGIHLYLASRSKRSVKNVLSHQGFVQDRKNRSATKFLIPRVAANIVVSEGLKEWLTTKRRLTFGDNTHVIYNGADPQRLAPTGRSIRTELELTKNVKLVGMVGNFYRDPRKDQLTVCRAMIPVMAARSDVHCIFAGGIQPGAEDKMAECLDVCLKSGIEHRVHFLGSRNDIPDILSELDVFVLSSLQEGMPVAISEAMLVGVPLVISDIGPHIEASQNGKYASLFPTGDAVALSTELIRLLSDKALREDLSGRAKAFAEDNMSIDSHIRQLISHYRSLIDA